MNIKLKLKFLNYKNTNFKKFTIKSKTPQIPLKIFHIFIVFYLLKTKIQLLMKKNQNIKNVL